jgi:hypothetical protein
MQVTTTPGHLLQMFALCQFQLQEHKVVDPVVMVQRPLLLSEPFQQHHYLFMWVDRAHLVTVPLVVITVVALQVQVTTMKALVVERQISELAQR